MILQEKLNQQWSDCPRSPDAAIMVRGKGPVGWGVTEEPGGIEVSRGLTG